LEYAGAMNAAADDDHIVFFHCTLKSNLGVRMRDYA
jgi:hypothetical protein